MCDIMGQLDINSACGSISHGAFFMAFLDIMTLLVFCDAPQGEDPVTKVCGVTSYSLVETPGMELLIQLGSPNFNQAIRVITRVF